MIIDVFGGKEWVGFEFFAGEIGFFEIDAGDLMVIVTGVISKRFFEVVAGGIDGDF